MRNPTPSSSTQKISKTTPCCSKVGMKRGPWTAEEDEVLANYIRREGEGRWRTLPKRAGLLRCGKSCRLRWMNYLRPEVKRGHIAPDEEDLILRLHRLLGNRWSLIAGRIPGRTDNEIKNYWNTHLSKKLISQGIDPRTHKPLNPNSSVDSHKPSSSNANLIIPKNPNPNPNFVLAPNSHEDNNNLQNFDGSGMENGEDDLNDDINCSSDDVFSSFLNSLINEDVLMINSQHHQVTLNQPTNVIESEPLMGSAQSNFAFGAGWDAPIMSASGTEVPMQCKHISGFDLSLQFNSFFE